MTFEEMCTTLNVTPEEQQALAEHLATIRAKATLKAFAPEPPELVRLRGQFTTAVHILRDCLGPLVIGLFSVGRDGEHCLHEGKATKAEAERIRKLLNKEVTGGPHRMFLAIAAPIAGVTVRQEGKQ